MRAKLRAAWRELAEMDRADLALRLLLVALLFQPVGNRWLRPPAMALAAIGLLAPSALASAWLWAALTALATARLALAWPVSDNHAFLLAYWCLAALLATLARQRDAVLAWNGRALIAGAFFFATLWKAVLSPDFLDGRFFAVTLVDDPRFESFAQLAAGLDEDALYELRDLVREHTDGVFVPWDEMPVPPPRLATIARAMAIATVAIEGAIALAFLLPLGWRIARLRDALLLLFCATTYALAPVAGFGWLLLSMGVAQLEPARRSTRALYVVAFLVVLLETRWPLLSGLVDRVR
jgi:hypothetical protein